MIQIKHNLIHRVNHIPWIALRTFNMFNLLFLVPTSEGKHFILYVPWDWNLIWWLIFTLNTRVPACTAHLYHLDDLLCCGHVDFLQAHHLNLLSVILQNPELGLLVQQVVHLKSPKKFHFKVTFENADISGKYSQWMCWWRREERFLSHFSIVNLKEADVGREIHVSISPVVDVGENILSWRRNNSC